MLALLGRFLGKKPSHEHRKAAGKAGHPRAHAAAQASLRRSAGEASPAAAGTRQFRSASAPSSVQPDSVPVRMISGLRFAQKVIETQSDLADVVFHSVINEKIRLAQHLYARIAVVQVSSSSKRAILFVDRAHVSSDDLEAVCRLVAEKDFKLNEDGVQAYECAPAYVIALSQGHLDQEQLSVERDIARDKNKSSLWNTFVEIVTWAYVNNADDLDFAVDLHSPSSQICFKIGGKYVRPARFLLPTNTLIEVLGIAFQKSRGSASGLFEIRTEQQAQVNIDLHKSQAVPNGARLRLRWSGLPYDRGTVVTLRLQRLGETSRVRSLSAGGYLPEQVETFKRAVRSEGGVIVFAGVVGSGKSTSLAQLINMLPRDIKIQTFEDPVELEMPGAYQKTITRDVFGTGTDPGFLAATRGLYRSALDAFLLGEIRDQETGLVARQVFESGHSVYTTVHAASALGIVDRLVSPAIGIPREVLASPGVLKLLVYQSLLPVTCPHCGLPPAEFGERFLREAHEIEHHHGYFERLERLYGIAPGRFRLRNPEGCPHCRKPELPELNGYAGRTVVAEMIEPDEEMLGALFQGNALELQRVWRSRGSQDFSDPNMDGRTAMECAIYKAGQGLIDPREIEPRFEAFETVERQRARGKPAKAQLRAVAGA